MPMKLDEFLRKLPKDEQDAIQVRAAELMAEVAADRQPELIGSMRDDADLMDEIVGDAMRARQISGWRPDNEDFASLESMAEATGTSIYALLDNALRLLLRQWDRQEAEVKHDTASEGEGSARQPIWGRLQERGAKIPEEVWAEWPHNPEGIDLAAADMSDPNVRQRLITELGRRMSDLSETAYCAGWQHGLEEQVPALCEQAAKTGKLQPFGGTVVCPGLAARLLAMREKLGHWVVPAATGGYEPYPPQGRA